MAEMFQARRSSQLGTSDVASGVPNTSMSDPAKAKHRPRGLPFAASQACSCGSVAGWNLELSVALIAAANVLPLPDHAGLRGMLPKLPGSPEASGRRYSTTIEPFMFGWNSQKYSYVPAVSNACVKNSLNAMAPDCSASRSSPVAVCGALS